MIHFLNGKFVHNGETAISPSDRAFLYGDGLFETLRVYGGILFLWDEHFQRMQEGATFLQLKLPFSSNDLRKAALELIEKNNMPESVLRFQVSRGTGVRGFSIKGADTPTCMMTLHPAPSLDSDKPLSMKLATASLRLFGDDPLARFKTCNKLAQIVARTEAESKGAGDALLLNHRGEIAETTSANIFWVRKGIVCTPPLSCGILPGITRALIQKICAKKNIPFTEKVSEKSVLYGAEAVFTTSSVMELTEIIELDGQKLNCSPLTGTLLTEYRKLVG